MELGVSIMNNNFWFPERSRNFIFWLQERSLFSQKSSFFSHLTRSQIFMRLRHRSDSLNADVRVFPWTVLCTPAVQRSISVKTIPL